MGRRGDGRDGRDRGGRDGGGLDWGGLDLDSPIRADITCSHGPDGPIVHEVTLGTDWTLETGHDLELERIAAALGSGVACVGMHDAVPVVRVLWARLCRRVPPPVAPNGRRRWCVLPAAPCCRSFEEARTAAAHCRTLSHVCCEMGADPAVVRPLLDLVVEGTDLVAPGNIPIALEPVDRGWASLVAEENGTSELWELGISPGATRQVQAAIGVTGALSARTYLHAITKQIDLTWLARLGPLGEPAVRWAAATHCDIDRADPERRLRWLELGTSPRDAGALMVGPYDTADIQQVALMTGLTSRAAAAEAAQWLQLGCAPAIDDLVLVESLGYPSPRRISATAIDTLLGARTWEPPISRTEAALVLAVAGTVPIATTLLSHGIRTARDAVAAL